jgi:ribonucleoside-diphosphate reductase alpha subunit
LAARIAISDLHKNTEKSFSAVIETFANMVLKDGTVGYMISDEVVDIVRRNKERLDSAIIHDRDYTLLSYFGLCTLMHGYLLRNEDRSKILERPQHMFMRVAVGIHREDIDRVIETYNLMSTGYFTHATPTLFFSGTKLNQMSSCFLMKVSDSLYSIYTMLRDAAMISKCAGGLGVCISDVRAEGTPIYSTNGKSNGIMPMLRVWNESARYVDQGGGKRMGTFGIYIEPWHADIFDFLTLKKNTGAESDKTRSLFLALWVPDLFMKRVESDGMWSLMCPKKCPGLVDSYGDKFERLYEEYESKHMYNKQVKARVLFNEIISSQIETGVPYMLYKDACNQKSNHKNLGTIRCSNVCTEIIEYTSDKETAVCNLASVCLPMFLVDGKFDYSKLHDVVKVMTVNLNRVIDLNNYPTKRTKRSNMRHRPIAIGVQGLAGLFMKMRIPYESDDAIRINKMIFETMYHAALEASCELAERDGAYESFVGSPYSEGILQFDMWGVVPDSKMYDWDDMRVRVRKGIRNSLLTTCMPTATTAQIMNNTESFEPITSCIFMRRTLSGDFVVIAEELVEMLMERGLYSERMAHKIIAAKGMLGEMEDIPADIKEIFKTSWEVKRSKYIDMSVDRGAYIDQSQSLNIYMRSPNHDTVTKMHFYGWKKGLKTGMYYLRSQSKLDSMSISKFLAASSDGKNARFNSDGHLLVNDQEVKEDEKKPPVQEYGSCSINGSCDG